MRWRNEQDHQLLSSSGYPKKHKPNEERLSQFARLNLSLSANLSFVSIWLWDSGQLHHQSQSFVHSFFVRKHGGYVGRQ